MSVSYFETSLAFNQSHCHDRSTWTSSEKSTRIKAKRKFVEFEELTIRLVGLDRDYRAVFVLASVVVVVVVSLLSSRLFCCSSCRCGGAAAVTETRAKISSKKPTGAG